MILAHQFGEDHKHQDRHQAMALTPGITLILQRAQGVEQTADIEHYAFAIQVDS